MLHFATKQINELIEAIQKSHWFFIATYVNYKAVPNNVMRDLVKMGFKKNQVLKFPELAFHFGLLSVYMKDADVKKLSFYKLKQSLKAGKLLPLSAAEKATVSIIEQRAVEGITGLGNKISSNLRTIAIEKDLKQRAQFEKIIKEKSKRAVQKRQSVKELVREIGHQTGDWARDLDRIADYILHEAYDNGRAVAAKKKYGDKLSFWGGLDIQDILPNGNEKIIYDEIKKLAEHMGKNGGYIISPAHSIQIDTPVKNIEYFYKASKKYGKYR